MGGPFTSGPTPIQTFSSAITRRDRPEPMTPSLPWWFGRFWLRSQRADLLGENPALKRVLVLASRARTRPEWRCGVPLFDRGRWRRVSEPREAARNRRLRAVHGSPAEQATIDRGRAEDRRVPKPDRVLAPHRLSESTQAQIPALRPTRGHTRATRLAPSRKPLG
jgi:hypothetical protein